MTTFDVTALQALPDEEQKPSFEPDIDAGCCSFTCGSSSCGTTCSTQVTP